MPDTFICPKVKLMEKKEKKMSFNDILVPDSITIKARRRALLVSELWLMELDLIELLNRTI